MLLALCVLLFTTLTCVGLLALWAATSRRHWFLRTMLFLSAVSPVLLIPAYEPFVAFVVQGATVAAGVQIARWLRRRKEPSPARMRLSVRDVLLAMPPIAVLCAVGVRLPEQEASTWVGVVAIGFVAGGTNLGVASLAIGQVWGFWRRLLMATLVAVVSGVAAMAADKIIAPATDDFWFTEEDAGLVGWFNRLAYATTPNIIWLPGFVLFVATSFLVVRLWRSDISSLPRIAAACLIACLALLPSYTLLRLSIRSPVPAPKVVDPNGFEDFVAAAQLIPKNPIVDSWMEGPEEATLKNLRAAVAEVSPALDKIREGVAKPVWINVDYDSMDWFNEHVDNYRGLRQAARGFEAEAELLQREGRADEAADSSLDAFEFGMAITRGGLLVDSLVGIAVSGISIEKLYGLKDDLSLVGCRAALPRLTDPQTNLESTEDFGLRDRVWTERVFGWPTCLASEMGVLAGEDAFANTTVDNAIKRHHALRRLLQVELALRAYYLQHNQRPNSLNQLAPELIPRIPSDPFAESEQPLRYLGIGDGYLLYSVGLDGIDDGGKPPKDKIEFLAGNEQADLRLDSYFAPEPQEEEPAYLSDEEVDDLLGEGWNDFGAELPDNTPPVEE